MILPSSHSPAQAGSRNGGGLQRTWERCNSYEDGQPPFAGKSMNNKTKTEMQVRGALICTSYMCIQL